MNKELSIKKSFRFQTKQFCYIFNVFGKLKTKKFSCPTETQNISFRANKINLLIIVLLAASCQLITTKTAYAASPVQSLSVSPVINDLQLVPGSRTTFPIIIRNNNSAPVGIHTETTGYDITGETSQYEQTPSVMTNWTTLSQNDILLDPKQSKKIIVTINTPKNIRQSGYYETIFLTPIGHQQEYANSPIILSRFGVLVLGTVGKLNYNDLSKKVLVTDVTPSFTLLDTFPNAISFSVANKYFTHFDAKPFITISPLFANSQTVELIDKHVLPGNERLWSYVPTVAKNHIFYQIHLAVSVGGGNQIFADTWFVVLPYQPILLSLFILILLYIGIKRRKRLGKVVKILVKG